MADYPILFTDRLVLRQFLLHEAPIVKDLAGAPEIARGTLNIPHPYGLGLAELWIACHETWFSEGTQVVFAITRKTDGWIIGAVGLTLDQEHNRAEIGYWIGVPFWSQGYATEASRSVIAYAFEDQMVHRITGSHFMRNQASGRVLEKIGLHREGLLREHLLKDGIYEDVIIYGILNHEWIRKMEGLKPGFQGGV